MINSFAKHFLEKCYPILGTESRRTLRMNTVLLCLPACFAFYGMAAMGGCSGSEFAKPTGDSGTSSASGSAPWSGASSTDVKSPATSGASTPAPLTAFRNDAIKACIGGKVYTNDVLPPGVGEFGTNGLDPYWGHLKSRTEPVGGHPGGSWGPGYLTSWGRHQYDTYFANEDHRRTDWPDPFYVGRDTAVPGSPQGLRIMAEPVPSPIATSLALMDNDQWVVTKATQNFEVPDEGGSVTVNVENPNGAQNSWQVGIGGAHPPFASENQDGTPAVTLIGTLTSGGATQSGNGTGGSNPWTISNVHVYHGKAGTTIIPGKNDQGGFRAYFFGQYYSGVLDTNVNQEYGFFVARLRLPPYLPALSPAFWTLETGGVADPPSGLQRNELDIEEMFGATSGNALNAGELLWNTSDKSGGKGIYGFPKGTPQHAYHDYGVLQTPQGTTFYLDGEPIVGDGYPNREPDWTQGSPDKEVMLMFQVAGPGTWLDPNSTAMSQNPWPQYMWAQWLRIYRPTSTVC